MISMKKKTLERLHKFLHQILFPIIGGMVIAGLVAAVLRFVL